MEPRKKLILITIRQEIQKHIFTLPKTDPASFNHPAPLSRRFSLSRPHVVMLSKHAMGITIKRVCCQSCGADLNIPEGVRFLNCNYCHSKLEVVEENSIIHTRLLEKVARQTEEMAGNLKVIELQNDLERLDREWADLKEFYFVHGKNGQRSMPSLAGSVMVGSIAIIGGIMWMAFTSGNVAAPGFFPLFGLVIIGVGIFSMVHGIGKASRYEEASRRHDQKRQELMNRIHRARQRE